MINLDRAEQLLSRLRIRHRDKGVSVPFILNPNQKNAIEKYKLWMADGNPLRVICVKSRRVGFSKLTDGLMFCHAAGTPLVDDMIVAHDFKPAMDLFRDPAIWAKSLPFALPDATKSVIRFNHPSGESTLKVATAGAVSGGRGLTLAGLHLSEASRYKDPEAFTSLLNTVSGEDPNSFVVIESTANGKTGLGETFYEYWQGAVEERNGFLPVFLCFLNDPGCVRDEDEAEDAPANDIERELMAKPYFATRGQIAWYRNTMESLCHGLQDVMFEEYPHNAEIAFLVSGDPAFSREEQALARENIARPLWSGIIEMTGDQKAEFKDARGPWHIWEEPDGASWYYFGVDAARGVETGDFGVIKIINGHTGRCAARLAERVDPERLAVLLYAAIHYYGVHPNTVNVEITGMVGWPINKALREGRRDLGIRAMSHVLHSWKPAKDDRQAGKGASNSIGWETTYNSRQRMIIAYRAAIRSKRRILLDEMCVKQMENAESSGHLYNFEVKRGHDDVLMGDMLTWICREDHPPPRVGGIRVWTPEQSTEQNGLPEGTKDGEATVEGCVRMMLGKHQRVVEAAIKAATPTQSLLEGI